MTRSTCARSGGVRRAPAASCESGPAPSVSPAHVQAVVYFPGRVALWLETASGPLIVTLTAELVREMAANPLMAGEWQNEA